MSTSVEGDLMTAVTNQMLYDLACEIRDQVADVGSGLPN
jgi:hypothetical protein